AAEGSIVVGGDTVVVHRGRVLGKPAHPSEARAMLAHLSGQTHEVLSGVAVARTEGSETVVESQVASATVHFFDLLPEEIDAYVATGEPLDKAGAYALQGRGAVLVDWIRGHPSTVEGRPIPDLRRLLARAGLESPRSEWVRSALFGRRRCRRPKQEQAGFLLTPVEDAVLLALGDVDDVTPSDEDLLALHRELDFATDADVDTVDLLGAAGGSLHPDRQGDFGDRAGSHSRRRQLPQPQIPELVGGSVRIPTQLHAIRG